MLIWGRHTTWENLFGPNGWCEAEQPRYKCGCLIDGLHGQLCDHPTEQFCLNSCTGRGTCVLGFCKCDDGWYGEDCSMRRAGLPMQPGVRKRLEFLDNCTVVILV